MGKPIFIAEGLKKYYDGRLVLNIPRLELGAGRVYALVGPNGSGKTILLHLLNLLEEPSEGKIYFQGVELTGPGGPPLELRRQMTLVAQDPLLFRATVFQNVAYGLRVRSLDRKEVRQRVKEVLALVGLSGYEGRKAYTLSGGEAQRVALARAIALKPRVLFLDEPTANIDREHLEVVESLIRKLNSEQGVTVLFTTHDPTQAYRLADDILALVDGRVVKATPDNFFSGQVEQMDGLKWLSLSPTTRICLATERTGRVHVSIPPEDIILSHHPLESSARNRFRGTITRAVAEGDKVRLGVDVGVELVALITRRSFEEMGLNLGSPVYLTFKSSAVRVF